MISSADAANHTTTISYTDSFSDGVNHSTLAYPTTVTDPDGNSSTMKYNYDFAAITEKQTPSPNAGQTPPKQSFSYDSVGRLSQITNNVNTAYVRYIYGGNYIQTWATVNTATDEAFGAQVFDGMGRVIFSATNHPGSTGG